jgi:hypothetical protein
VHGAGELFDLAGLNSDVRGGEDPADERRVRHGQRTAVSVGPNGDAVEVSLC